MRKVVHKNMKTTIPILFLLALLGCQPQEGAKEKASSKIGTSVPAASPTEIRQEQDILQKDTLNAVQEEVVKKPSAVDPADFKEVFQQFNQAIQEGNAQAFHQYIDPVHGLYIIDTPGAMPQFTHVKDIRQYKRFYQNLPFFTIKEYFKSCDLQAIAVLPKVTCEGEEPYTQKGCFVADAAAFRKNTAVQYTELPEAQKKTIAQTQLLVDKTVLHTASGFKFHFAQINGHWRVLFIDLMIPCSA